MGDKVSLSVVVATRNRLRRLRYCLQSILTATRDGLRLELVIVDDASHDGTAAYLKTLAEAVPTVRVVRNSTPGGPAVARNLGIANCSGDFIAFTDDDCTVSSSWLMRLCDAMENGAEAIGGRVRVAIDHKLAQYLSYVRALEPLILPEGGLAYFVTANACIRRDTLARVNGFDETFTSAAGEDSDLSERLRAEGVTLRYAPQCEVQHWYEPSLDGFLGRFYRYGIGNRHVFDRHQSSLWWEPDAPANLAALLTGRSPLRRFAELRGAAQCEVFCALHALQSLAYLAGYLRIQHAAQLHHLLGAASATSSIELAHAMERRAAKVNDSIAWLASIAADQEQALPPAADTISYPLGNNWMGNAFFSDTGKADVVNALTILDLDVLLSRVQAALLAGSEPASDVTLPPNTRPVWDNFLAIRERDLCHRRARILVDLCHRSGQNTMPQIEEMCLAAHLDVNHFLWWCGNAIEGQDDALQCLSEEARDEVLEVTRGLRGQPLAVDLL